MTLGHEQLRDQARERVRRWPAWRLRRAEAQLEIALQRLAGSSPGPTREQLAELAAIRRELVTRKGRWWRRRPEFRSRRR